MRRRGRTRWFLGLPGLVLLPQLGVAADLGSMTYEGERTALGHACAYVPRFDMQGWGKPEVTVLLSSVPLDCTALGGWANPDTGAFEEAVDRGDGALLSLSFQPGLKLGRVSVYGVGFTLGNDTCEGCQTEAAYAGAGLRGRAKTTRALTISDSPLTFDVRFDLPKPAPPAPGEKLPAGGGEPGKAYLASLKAFQDGDYAALQRLLPEGEAEEKYGYYAEGAERKEAIQNESMSKSAKVLEGWKIGDAAILVVEAAHPFDPSEKAKAVIGLGFDGTGWRMREERFDFGGTILGNP